MFETYQCAMRGHARAGRGAGGGGANGDVVVSPAQHEGREGGFAVFSLRRISGGDWSPVLQR